MPVDLKELINGNPDALNSLVRENLPQIFNLSLRLCHNREEAEDLTQDVFIKAVRALPRFQGECKVSTWLFRITINAWKNKLRHDAVRHKKNHFSMDADNTHGNETRSSFDIEDSTPSVETVIEIKELSNRIFIALDRMEPDSRSIVLLRDINQLSYEEIAETMEIPLGTVKSRLSRARENLREILSLMGGPAL